MGLSKVEMVRRALEELGEASSEKVSAFIERRHGVRIDARFIPIVRASILELEMLEKARQAAREAVAATERASTSSRTETDAATQSQDASAITTAAA